MRRETVRTLKRAVREGVRPGAGESDRRLSGYCALALLARSITFGHGRQAVIRLAMAVDAGAEIPQEHWMYCARAARASNDHRLQELYQSASMNAPAGIEVSSCTEEAPEAGKLACARLFGQRV